MATNLITNPKPTVTRYSRLALWAGISAVVLVGLAYSLVIRDHGHRVVEPRKAALTTSAGPLVPELPKADPPPPPEPKKEQPYLSLPKLEPAQESPPPHAPVAHTALPQPNPLVELRKKEKQEGLRSGMLVAAFNPEKAQQPQGARPAEQYPTRNPQTLEIEPQHQEQWGEQAPMRGQGFGMGRQPQYLNAQLQPPRSPYQINAGMQLPVVLAQDVTSDVQSFFSAIVTRDVYDSVSSRYLLIPAGSRITFLTDLDDRVNQQPILLMSAKTLYLPNGSSIALQGMPAANSFGMAGLRDEINRHFLQRYGSAAVLSLVTAGVRMATYSRGGGGYAYSPMDAAINGTGSVLGNTIGEDLHNTLSIKPTVVVRAGYLFQTTVTQDITFPGPYAATGVTTP